MQFRLTNSQWYQIPMA